MRKFFTIISLFMVHGAFAGTGTAEDAYLFSLTIIALLGLALSVLYSISFIKKFIKQRRERTVVPAADEWSGNSPE
jgi:uncharacterized membrane protein YoaK (UPF0700 family)